MGDMSEDQEKALEQFRKYIKDNNITEHPQYDDYYLLRFLRARKFEMDKTILMFNTFMEWRKENDVDNILEVREKQIKNNGTSVVIRSQKKTHYIYLIMFDKSSNNV